MDATWLLAGFSAALQPVNLMVAVIGCFLGTLVGVLPGLGPTSAVALLFPFTVTLSPAAALIGMGAIYYGAMYGGSTTAILLNIPGEVSAVPTAMEGFPLTKQGRAGPALVICALVSFLGGIISLVGLTFFAPWLGDIALTFGPYEYLALMLLSLACAAALAGSSVWRGMGSALLGLFIAMIGADPGTTIYRFTYGITTLYSGFDVIPVVVGLFGIGEVLVGIRQEIATLVGGGQLKGLLPSRREATLGFWSGLRGSFLGAVTGLLPGITPSVSSFLAYSVEKRVAKERGLFGRGAIEGIAGPEAANNAAAVSGFIPLMALGIPTGPVLAIVLAALMIQGVIPGPLMFTTYRDLTATVIASFLIGNAILVVLNVPLVGLWVRIATIPYRLLAPIIIVLCALGAYSIRNSMFDLWVMVAFGVLGYLAKGSGIPIAPFVLGLILGGPLEFYFRQVATLGMGGLLARPIAIAALVVAAAFIGLFTVFKEKEAGLVGEQ